MMVLRVFMSSTVQRGQVICMTSSWEHLKRRRDCCIESKRQLKRIPVFCLFVELPLNSHWMAWIIHQSSWYYLRYSFWVFGPSNWMTWCHDWNQYSVRISQSMATFKSLDLAIVYQKSTFSASTSRTIIVYLLTVLCSCIPCIVITYSVYL